jgi:group I intron endonuclease
MIIKIYAHKNKINGKYYIGITSQSIKKRWGTKGSPYKNQTKFANAIKKYGWNNFEHIVLEETDSMTTADKLEKEYIKRQKKVKRIFR